jgi:hypothetical protein
MAILHQTELARSYGDNEVAQLKHLLEHLILRTV